MPLCYHHRGTIRNEKGDQDGAIADINEAIRLDPENADNYNVRGLARLAKGNKDGAMADYNEAIRLDPKLALAYYNRGIARQEKGDQDGAIADYSEAIRLDPNYAPAYNNRGTVRQEKGDQDGEMADYNEAIRLDPKLAPAYYNRGQARRAKGDQDGAIADYSEAIRLDPKDATVYRNRGIARQEKGNMDGAIADYTEAIRLNPKDATAYNNRGIARQDKGDVDRAIADFTEAIRLSPKFADAYHNRGIARSDKGDVEGMLADQARAYETRPKAQIEVADAESEKLANTIHHHFTTVLLSELRQMGERFVEYYPCGLLWGRREFERRRPDGSAYIARTGSHGTGYICVTDQSLHLVTLGALTKQFSTYSSGWLGGILGYALRNVDEIRPETSDQSWRIPWRSIMGAQPSTDSARSKTYIQILSGPNWEVYAMFTGDFNEMLTVLNMGISGRLANIWEEQPAATSRVAQSSGSASIGDDIFEKLKKLDELRKVGIVSDAEFEEKKKELLSRL